MPYDRDQQNHYCARCKANPTLVRCFKSQGKANGRSTQCAACESTRATAVGWRPTPETPTTGGSDNDAALS
jgi:hypothetical protein